MKDTDRIVLTGYIPIAIFATAFGVSMIGHGLFVSLLCIIVLTLVLISAMYVVSKIWTGISIFPTNYHQLFIDRDQDRLRDDSVFNMIPEDEINEAYSFLRTSLRKARDAHPGMALDEDEYLKHSANTWDDVSIDDIFNREEDETELHIGDIVYDCDDPKDIIDMGEIINISGNLAWVSWRTCHYHSYGNEIHDINNLKKVQL